MKFNYNDGGREAAGFKGKTGDCVCRAIAIATELPYKQVYDLINEFAKKERSAARTKSSARSGVRPATSRKVLKSLGWKFVATMGIGTGCTIHLREGELPMGRIICKTSHHLVAVIDGVINDTYDCTRDGNRCVYGYYIKEN